jgi:gliding motility-associated-like protein
LKGKDEIADLFKEQLSNHKVNVDPSVWNGISSSLSSASSVGSVLSSVSLITKIVALSSGLVLLGLGTYFLVNDSTQHSISSTEIITEEILSTTLKRIDTIIETPESEKKKNEKVVLTKTSVANKELKTEYIQSDELIEFPYHSLEEKTDLEEQIQEENKIQIDTKIQEEIPIQIEEGQKFQEDKIASFSENTIIPELTVKVDKVGNQLYRFQVLSDEFSDIQWEFDEENFSIGNKTEYYFSNSGEHKVIVSGYFKQEIVVKELPISIEIEGQFTLLPNVFTPDNDGVNDQFFIESKGLTTFQLSIFDTSNKLVYQSKNPNFSWNGLHHLTNEKVPSGTYYYTIAAEDAQGNYINTYQQLKIIY